MKYFLTILMLFRVAYGQVSYDTQPRLIPVIKTSTSNIFNEQRYWLRGYRILKTVGVGQSAVTTTVGYLWWDRKKKIQPPYILDKWNEDIPINGYDFP